MNSYRKTIFISDLHLEEKKPEITKQFLQFLQQCDSLVDKIYILGDLFEAWIGDDNDTHFNLLIINTLRSITNKGIPIYFIRGNRDFLIGNQFLKKTGCQLLADEEKIFLYGTPVLIMHGDTLCTKDIAYLKARKKARNPLLQTLFLFLPLILRKKIAESLRNKSQIHQQLISDDMMDVTQAEVEHVMEKHQVKYLIHGHTHKLNTHQFSLNNHLATRVVLGAWHDEGNAFVWDESGKRELVIFE